MHCKPGFVLKVGHASEELRAEHRRRRVDCSAFLTSGNPFSSPLEPAADATRQAELADELLRRGLGFLPGVGQHPSNGWPGEDSFLILGLRLDAARELAVRFGQNGFIWCGPDVVPHLILVR